MAVLWDGTGIRYFCPVRWTSDMLEITRNGNRQPSMHSLAAAEFRFRAAYFAILHDFFSDCKYFFEILKNILLRIFP